MLTWRVAFDIGGVLSKYPEFFKAAIAAFEAAGIECHIITDMYDHASVLAMLNENGIGFFSEHVHVADYNTHGEACKAVVMKEHGINVLFDDFIGYVDGGAFGGDAPIRLLVMPDASKPYWHDDWKADGDFGRRRRKD